MQSTDHHGAAHLAMTRGTREISDRTFVGEGLAPPVWDDTAISYGCRGRCLHRPVARQIPHRFDGRTQFAPTGKHKEANGLPRFARNDETIKKCKKSCHSEAALPPWESVFWTREADHHGAARLAMTGRRQNKRIQFIALAARAKSASTRSRKRGWALRSPSSRSSFSAADCASCKSSISHSKSATRSGGRPC